MFSCALLAAACGQAAALAQVDPSLPKEMPQPGDTWTYAVVDLRYNPFDRSRKYVHTVRNVSRQSIVEIVTAEGEQIAESVFTADLGAIYRTRADVLEVAPFVTAFRALQPGDRWGPLSAQGADHIVIRGGEVPYAIDRARVVGNERVAVPAGSFEAIRVEVHGRIARSRANYAFTPGIPVMPS